MEKINPCKYLLFSWERTSEINLSLLEWIEVGKGVVDKVCCQPHCGDVLCDDDDGIAICRAVVELSLLLVSSAAMPVGTLVVVVAGSAFATAGLAQRGLRE